MSLTSIMKTDDVHSDHFSILYSRRLEVYLPLSYRNTINIKTSSGSLRTPFSDKLFYPVNDRNTTQGVIGSNSDSEDIPKINIRTSFGSIKIDRV